MNISTPTLTPTIWDHTYYHRKPDYLIVGAGITGLSTALHLLRRSPSAHILIVEAQPSGNLASTRNAGFACFGSVSELIDDIAVLGEDEVCTLLSARYEGLALLRQTIGDDNLKYKATGGTEVFLNRHEDLLQDCLEKMDYFNELTRYTLGTEHTYQAQAHGLSGQGLLPTGIFNPHEGILHPVHMMTTLTRMVTAAGGRILRGQRVESIQRQDHQVMLSSGVAVSYDRLIVCTNSLAKELLPDLDVDLVTNIVGYARCRPGFEWDKCYHADRGYLYFRRVDRDHILLGGGRNITATNYRRDLAEDDRIKTYLTEVLHDLTGDASLSFEGFWKGYLGVGSDRMPIVRHLGDDVYCGVRLGGMGVAIGSYLGMQLSGLASGTNS